MKNDFPRFLREYANYTINQYRELAKQNPGQIGDYTRMINKVNAAVWNCERGYITIREAMRNISDSIYAE